MEIAYNKENSGHVNSYAVGEKFQDFVCIELAKHGIYLQNINSKKFQFDTGENLQGWEIKYDGRCTGENGKKASGRLSIEVAEKTNKNNLYYVNSGIYRGDNSWLYIQGCYTVIYIFSVTMLRLLYESNEFDIHEKDTVKSFYLTFEDADRYCAKKLTF